MLIFLCALLPVCTPPSCCSPPVPALSSLEVTGPPGHFLLHYLPPYMAVHRRLLYKEHTSTHAHGTDPRMALGAKGELPWIYLDAWGGKSTPRPYGRLKRRPAAPRVPLGPPPPPSGNGMSSA